MASYPEAFPQMVLAQVEMARKDYARALQRLEIILETAELGGHNDNMLKIMILKSLAYDALGDRHSALEELGQALAIGVPAGYVRSFLDHGQPFQSLLQQIARSGRYADYAARFLTAFPP